MKHNRRKFIQLSAGSVGALAVPPGKAAEAEDHVHAPILEADTSGGAVSVTPSEGVAGDFGTWNVTYRVGPNGIRENGGVRVQLPDSWHAGIRNSANRLQSSDPRGENYIIAHCSRAGVKLRTWVENEPPGGDPLVKNARHGLDGRYERYIYVIRVWVTEGELQEGDKLTVVYGDTSAGSKGMRAAVIRTHPEALMLAVDSTGTGAFRMHPDRPTLVSRAGLPVELMVWGPATLIKDQPAELGLAAVDANANPAPFDGEVELRVTKGSAKVPATARFQSNEGWMSIPIVPTAPGILRVEARVIHEANMDKPRPIVQRESAFGEAVPEQTGRRAFSNPMRVHESEPRLKTYWGELHSHTHYSWDGVGDENFPYARRVSGLDFYAMTDHSNPTVGRYTQGLGPHVWEEYTAKTERFYEPGKFATLHAYECSFDAPYGHHNVFFHGKPGPLFAPQDISLPDLWAALKAGEALTIPHHTGKFPRPVFWFPHNNELDRNIEIYSAHGLSESYDPRGPLSFERSLFTEASHSVNGPQFVQDAWMQGLELSTVAASDDHRAHPGQPHFGRTAVAATGLTREEVFDALYHRRTYGTTGAKILLDFSINGEPMGGTVTASGPPKFEVEAHGTDVIDFVEILRFGKSDGTFLVIQKLYPDDADFQWTGTDSEFKKDSIYYLRLRQVRMVRTRVAMAWSSPIWVKRG